MVGGASRWVCLVVLGAGMVVGSPAFAQQDTTPPVLVGLSLDRLQIDTSAGDETITATAHVTDDLSGVLYVAMACFSPSGMQ